MSRYMRLQNILNTITDNVKFENNVTLLSVYFNQTLNLQYNSVHLTFTLEIESMTYNGKSAYHILTVICT